MNFGFLINISLLAIAFCSVASLLYSFALSRRSAKTVDILANARQGSGLATQERSQTLQVDDLNIDDIKDAAEKFRKVSAEEYWIEQYFRAGFFMKNERDWFRLFRILCLFLLPVVFAIAASFIDIYMGALSGVLGLILGWRLPFSVIDRIIQKRDYDILYYLPLEVEQLVIGVSSSLDIGPCIQNLVSMADERDCHNPVTELFRYVQHHVKAGASLNEALKEVGRLSCHTELKHTFMALSQVTRHGGEITKQLQQLADSVSQQRETKVDAKIKRLELEATGPVALVFLAFMGILLVGLGTQVAMVFQQ